MTKETVRNYVVCSSLDDYWKGLLEGVRINNDVVKILIIEDESYQIISSYKIDEYLRVYMQFFSYTLLCYYTNIMV